MEQVLYELENPSPIRIWAVAKAFEKGMNVQQVFARTKIDRWFLAKLYHIHKISNLLVSSGSLAALDAHPTLLLTAKQTGFSDKKIAALLSEDESSSKLKESGGEGSACDGTSGSDKTKKLRKMDSLDLSYVNFRKARPLVGAEEVHVLRLSKNIHPSIKQVDTVAGEFPAQTNYLYLTYNGESHDVDPILGASIVGKKRSATDCPASPKFKMTTPPRPNSKFTSIAMNGIFFPIFF